MSASILPLAVASSSRSTTSIRAGRLLTGLVLAFLTLDVAMKFMPMNRQALDAMSALGWQAHSIPVVGMLGLACLVLYAIPRTAPLGAVLWTGYLGGAVATHLRVDNPLFSHTLFPVYIGALLWGALYLRDARVRNAVRAAR